MKAILVIDVPVLDDGRHLCNECPIWNKEHLFCQYDFNMEAKGCPLKPIHALKSGGHDYIIYERQYLYKNLEREYEIMKKAREYESNISY